MNGTNLAPSAKIQSIRALLTRQSVKDQLAMVAPKHLTPDRILRIAMTSIQRTPKLLDCTPESLIGCLLTCTQLGLEPDSVSGKAYLIPYKTTATLIIGYRGLCELARRSGEISDIDATVVYERDQFTLQQGTEPKIEHKPFLEGDAGPARGAYAVAFYKDGMRKFKWMDRTKIEAIRARSRAANDGPWVTDWEEMACKTVIRRLCKYLPSSPELSRAIGMEEDLERGIPSTVDVFVDPSVPAADTQSRTETAATAVQAATQSLAPVEPKQEASEAPPATEPKAKRGRSKTRREPTKTSNACSRKFMDLSQPRRDALKKDFKFEMVGECHRWDPDEQNDLLVAIQDAAKEQDEELAAAKETDA